METLLEIISWICGSIYFIVLFIWFLTSENLLDKFFGWVEKEIKSLRVK